MTSFRVREVQDHLAVVGLDAEIVEDGENEAYLRVEGKGERWLELMFPYPLEDSALAEFELDEVSYADTYTLVNPTCVDQNVLDRFMDVEDELGFYKLIVELVG